MSLSDTKQSQERPEDAAAALSSLAEFVRTNPNLLKIIGKMEESHARELFFLYRHPWQIIWINFLAGLSRGIGLTVGTALFLAAAAYVLGKFISLPHIGEYIARLLDIVDAYRGGAMYR